MITDIFKIAGSKVIRESGEPAVYSGAAYPLTQVFVDEIAADMRFQLHENPHTVVLWDSERKGLGVLLELKNRPNSIRRDYAVEGHYMLCVSKEKDGAPIYKILGKIFTGNSEDEIVTGSSKTRKTISDIQHYYDGIVKMDSDTHLIVSIKFQDFYVCGGDILTPEGQPCRTFIEPPRFEQ